MYFLSCSIDILHEYLNIVLTSCSAPVKQDYLVNLISLAKEAREAKLL